MKMNEILRGVWHINKVIDWLIDWWEVYVEGTVASWLVHSSLDQGVWVWTHAEDIVLCSWARHLTLTVPLSTQVYTIKWVPANLMLAVTLW